MIPVTSAPPYASVPSAAARTGTKSSVPKAVKTRNMATRKPASPIRFMMNAFFPAFAYSRFSYQKPMSRYEQSPTPSHPTNISGKLAPRTRTSMKKTKRLR